MFGIIFLFNLLKTIKLFHCTVECNFFFIQHRKLGPGTYEIKDFLEVSDGKPRSTRGIIQTKESRFKEKLKNETPGPGTYGDGGVPHAAKEEKYKQSPGKFIT